MKRGTENLLKFRKLKARLGLPMWQVKGLLQAVWDFTAENAPLGDIGRHPNEDIAFGIEYEGDPEALVAALVQTRWLDEHPEHRLVVHDWHEHAEDWLRKRVSRGAGCFVTETRKTNGAANNGRQRPPPADAGGQRRPAMPSPAQPSQAITMPSPAQSKPRSALADGVGQAVEHTRRASSHSADFQACLELEDRIVKATGDAVWREWWRDVIPRLASYREGGWLEDLVERVEVAGDENMRKLKDVGKFTSPGQYLVKHATKKLKEHGARWPGFPEERKASGTSRT